MRPRINDGAVGRRIRFSAVVVGAMAVLAGCVSVEFGVGVETVRAPVKPPTTPTSLAIPADTEAPDQAGGLSRNRETEAVIPDLLTQVRDQLPADLVVPGSVKYAVYHQPDVAAPDGDIFLARGTTTDPDAMLEVARARPRQDGAPTEFELEGGTRGVCTQSRNSGDFLVPACAWVTADTFAQIAPLVPLGGANAPLTTSELADVMRKMLPDLR